MKFYVLLFLITFQETPDLIREYHQYNQLIILYSEDNRSPSYEKTLLAMAKDPLGLDERDIIIIEVFSKGGIRPDGTSLTDPEVASLREYYALENTSYRIILVNRESREIFRSDQPMNVQEIFYQFDQSGN